MPGEVSDHDSAKSQESRSHSNYSLVSLAASDTAPPACPQGDMPQPPHSVVEVGTIMGTASTILDPLVKKPSAPALTTPAGPSSSSDAPAPAPPHTPGFEPPTLWGCASQQLPIFCGSAILLCGGMVGLFTSDGQPVDPAYCAAYVAFAIVVILGTFAILVFRLQQMLRLLGEHLPAVLGVDQADFSSKLSPDVRVRYLQHVVFQESRSDKPKPAPLDFIQSDLREWADCPQGYVVIDTTGVMLWVNTALCEHFGYDRDSLLQENVRMLMPSPYSQQHDQFLRRHLKTGKRNVLGLTRQVPIKDSTGRQSIVMLSVDDRVDPFDSNNRLFIGRMVFNQGDAILMAMQEKILTGICKVADACVPLDGVADSVAVMEADGTLLFMNKSGCELFGYTKEEVKGRNVKILMGEPFASAHDGFLQRYQERAETSRKSGTQMQSNVVGSGRDVMAKTKSNKTIRVFLMVQRLDRPSRLAKDCLFVGKMVHIAAADSGSIGSRNASFQGSEQMSEMTARSNHHKPGIGGVYKWHPLGGMRRVKCTVLVLEVHGLVHTNATVAHNDYELLLGLVFGACSRHRGVLHWVMGSRLVVTFNAAALVNTSHRSSCAGFMLQMEKSWRDCPMSMTNQMYMAAVSRECQVATWGQQHLIFGDSMDVCGAMLRVAIETKCSNGLIDSSLNDELCYSYTCRTLNELILYPDSIRQTNMEVFELISMKQSAEDEWMYQISVQDDGAEAISRWQKCWECLLGVKSPTGRCRQASNFERAHDFILAHLELHADDPQGLWLEKVLLHCKGCVASNVVEVSGLVPYVIQYRLPEVESSSKRQGPRGF
eukprot:GGOE01007767.1.p1 GENE.GGOE01007767.1~~GGOE01007767.1.p1  ORF type:complete len:840 (+),score=214.56 GGOE01007767.1:45-2522(+)